MSAEMSVKNDWLLSLSLFSAQNSPQSQFLFNNEVLSEIGTFSWYPDQDLAFFCSARETQHGAGHCIVSSQHCCCSPKEMAYCRRCPKKPCSAIISSLGLLCFSLFSNLRKAGQLGQERITIVSRTDFDIYCDENIRPQNVAIALLIRISYPL